MISWIAAGFLVAGFIVLARLLGLAEKGVDVVAISRRSLAIIRNPGLSDETKETALQKNAARLFRLAFDIALGGTMSVCAPLGILWLADRLGLISLEFACAVVVSPAFIGAGGLLIVIPLAIGPYLKKRRMTAKYSFLDRVLHRVGFRTCAAQVSLADLEDRKYAKQIALCGIERPVFITALPRAGTTMLLECFADMGEFAAHCYRDMPFVLVPCLWNRFSASFRRNEAPRERAHGDGMLIDYDSPEALEEVLWKAFWRRHYRADRIVPWTNDEEICPEFRDFFRGHLRKIIIVRRGQQNPTARYLSKNNLNIARTALLRRLFPDAVVVVPFRNPVQHAASLLKQHRNFLRIHKEEPFASEYMQAIGHYDFGENLRPIDFDGWFDRRQSENADCLTFWLEYWTAVYRHLLECHADGVHFADYDAICENPERGLQALAEAIGCRETEGMLSRARKIHAARTSKVDTGGVPCAVLREAGRVHAELKSRVAPATGPSACVPAFPGEMPRSWLAAAPLFPYTHCSTASSGMPGAPATPLP